MCMRVCVYAYGYTYFRFARLTRIRIGITEEYNESRALACEMLNGVRVCDRTYRLRLYRRCFTGEEATNFIQQHKSCDVHTAVSLGNAMLKYSFIYHVRTVFELAVRGT
jgi:hypothetical protein